MKGVFDTKPDSGYDDDITRRYHFPSQYKKIADQLVRDWILYREPRRNNGRQAYIATARVIRIDPDPAKPGHFYAILDEYLELDPPVPFRESDQYWETPLRALEPAGVGAYLQGRSVRLISNEDFSAIVLAGLRRTFSPANITQFQRANDQLSDEVVDFIHAPIEEQQRQIEQVLLNRKVRDANFRDRVCDAYENRCAITRLRIINGGGRAEVQAAHIWSVTMGGPDVVQNGLALSGTAHWLFDRYLISLTDDWKLLVSHNKVPAELRQLFAQRDERIHLPKDKRLWPHPAYIARHRQAFSGG